MAWLRLLLLALLLGRPSQAQQSGWAESAPQSSPAPQDSLEAARSQELSVLDQLQGIDQQLAGVQAELVALEDRVAILEDGRARGDADLAEADARLARQRSAVSSQLTVLYRLHKQGLARVIFGAEDPADLRRRGTYLMRIIDADLARMDAFLAALATKREALAAVERDVRALDALRAELQVKASELNEQRERRITLLEDIRSRRELSLRAMGEMKSARRDLDARLSPAAAVAQPDAAAADLPGSPPGEADGGSFRAAYGRLEWPVSGRVQNAVEGRGIDIQAEYGTPVRAAYGGTVKLAGYVRGYGQTVALEHGPYTTVYSHLGGIRVRQGQPVASGDVIGLVGNTGLTNGEGYVLTFEVRYNGTPQDPRPWLRPR
jgi:septal ring factor EnvC (AmiA/AmiB activator)